MHSDRMIKLVSILVENLVEQQTQEVARLTGSTELLVSEIFLASVISKVRVKRLLYLHIS